MPGLGWEVESFCEDNALRLVLIESNGGELSVKLLLLFIEGVLIFDDTVVCCC